MINFWQQFDVFVTCLHCYSYLRVDELHCVSNKNNSDVGHYNFNAHQPILVIFGGYFAERLCYQMVICYPTSPNKCFCTTWGNMNMNPENCVFSIMLYRVSWKRQSFCLLCPTLIKPIFIFFVDNKVILLGTVCKYYFSPSCFVFDTLYTAWLKVWKGTISGGSCFPR